ncbi:FixH family protein [Flavobacterium sp.]|uniref:FixH family protein n=1 Tax=Flavobacterium sp. TaxID=239 RepID=UPI00262174D8|nr:FixH family protein [Flavobacterium sp.]MDD3003822.1 FixH family protein [Flavobacterium sp.]
MKFKIGWGTSIIIAFASFIAFILFFVFTVQSDSKYDNELVVDEYYKKDALYGEDYIKMQNAQDLQQKPQVIQNADSVVIIFPSLMKPQDLKGKVSFYRPSNKKLDFQVPISLSKPSLLIPKTNLVGGRWDIFIDWEYQTKSYKWKETVYIN